MPKKTRKSPAPIVLAIALLVAVALMVYMVMQKNALTEQNVVLDTQLKQSQANVKDLSAEKEALKKDLNDVQGELREVNLSLEESTAKVARLEEDVASLTNLNTVLNTELEEVKAVQLELTEYIATTTDLLQSTQLELASATDALASATDALVAAENNNIELTQQLMDAQAVVVAVSNDVHAAREKQLETLEALKQHLETSLAQLNLRLTDDNLTAEQRANLMQSIETMRGLIDEETQRIDEVNQLLAQ